MTAIMAEFPSAFRNPWSAANRFCRFLNRLVPKVTVPRLMSTASFVAQIIIHKNGKMEIMEARIKNTYLKM